MFDGREAPTGDDQGVAEATTWTPRGRRGDLARCARMGGLAVQVPGASLPAVRSALAGADEVLLGVAFVARAGVNLLVPQLERVREGRLVATTVFGSTAAQGLGAAGEAGLAVRVLNPASGTFHPKVYLARHGGRVAAVVGSANLTQRPGGQRGERGGPARPGRRAAAEGAVGPRGGLVASSRGAAVDGGRRAGGGARSGAAGGDPRRARDQAGRAHAGRRQPNRVHEVTPDGVWVETGRSRAACRPPQQVPAWIIQVAWDYLRAHRALSNRVLLADNGLNVKRSSFVCALLARLPGVEVVSRRPIELVLR